jgi:hypothetical protein
VIVAKRASSHIQKIAPGPPIESAVATPAILPIPTVLANAVLAAWKGVILPLILASSTSPAPPASPAPPSVFTIDPNVLFRMNPSFLT